MFSKSVLKISIATALCATALVSPTHADQPLPIVKKDIAVGSEPALDLLRKLNRNPALSHSALARQEALLATGSVVKSNGKNRVLYHLPATSKGLRLSGESAHLEWPVHIARAQMGGKILLRIAYRNAVSVMPEASNLVIEVNGVVIGKSTIQSSSKSRVLEFAVPQNLVVPGVNAVKVSARQRHRVDCSINATHELWTDIDPSKSGLIFDRGNSALKTLESLSAIARNKAGQVKMRLLANKDRQSQQLQRVMKMAQHAAIYAHFDNPQVEVASKMGNGAGLDVFVGTLKQLNAIAPSYAQQVASQGGLHILARDGDERLALILITGEVTSDRNSEAFEKQLAVSFAPRKRIGSKQGLVLASRSQKNQIEEGEKIAFGKLGLTSQEFDGRLYRGSFSVELPSDYFSADYDRAEMHLAMGYAAGLNRNNKFVIRVNGVTATGFALSNPAGHIFQDKMLRVPLSSFKPGTNSIEIEAQLQKGADDKCDPVAQIGDDKRFVLSGNSWIRFPRLARLAKMPSLSGTVSAGFPYVLNGRAVPTILSVPTPDYSSLSAAAGFMTHVATRAGVPLDFDLKYNAPRGDVESAIIISPYNQLPQKLAKSISGIDHTRLKTAWQLRNNAERSRQIAILDLQTEGGIDTMTTAGVSDTQDENGTIVRSSDLSKLVDGGDPLANWNSETIKRDKIDDGRLTFTGHVASMFRTFLGWNQNHAKAKQRVDNVDSDILITQQLAPSSKGVWTVVTAPSNEALQSGVSLMVKPEIANNIAGETATVNGIDRTVTSSITSQSYVQVNGFSLRNLQLIVAGWFSNNHHVFSLILLAALLGFGAVSTRLLSVVGVDRAKEEEKSNNA